MRGAGERGAVRAVVRWAGHPGTLAALVVLLVNDHLGKRLWPGAVTGKVSDLAWMLVSPVVLALLLTPVLRLRGDRPAIAGLAVTGAMFGFAKSGPWGGEVASAVWSWSGVPSRIQGDRSDLVALPALGVSWWLWKRSRTARRGSWRPVAAVLGVPLAVFAMVATSTMDRPESLWVKGSRAMLSTDEGWWTAKDGGASWSPASWGSDLGAEEAGGQHGEKRCTVSERPLCFRVRDDASPIETSEDGGQTWYTAFDPGERRRRTPPSFPAVTRSERPAETPVEAPAEAPAGTPGESPSTTLRRPAAQPVNHPAEMLVVTAPEGWAVIVNYPGRGLVRGTPDGVWTLQSYPLRANWVAPEQPRHWFLGLPVAVAAGFAGVLAVAAVWLLRTTAPAGRRREVWFLLLRQGLCLFWVWLAAWLCGGELVWRVPGVLVAGVLTVGLLPILWALRHGPDRASSRLLPLAAGGAAVVAVALLPYLLWAGHRLSAWSQASGLAFLCALTATVAGAVVGFLTPPPPPRPGPPVQVEAEEWPDGDQEPADPGTPAPGS
ncbi:hypothetical protein ACIQ9P_07485 [Kitasatospora sp. NPDC094019]|uniref:hypothetical protein n=1 Tax=Kitasatospora sp. NPDC094019 TaxID=3364091 RepID=UPI0037F7D05E